MDWNLFNTYGDSPQNAFETLCNQLFERYLRKEYEDTLIKFRIINGAGGDGGIEAYGQLSSLDIIAVQSKWFRQRLKKIQFTQIEASIVAAKDLRPNIKEYIICIPRAIGSIKKGKGGKPIENYEEKAIETFQEEIKKKYPDLKLTWWFDNEILTQLQNPQNEGVHKYWFDRETLTFELFEQQLELQKAGWLYERYIPQLHGEGLIQKEYDKVCFNQKYRRGFLNQVNKSGKEINTCITLIDQLNKTGIKDKGILEKLEKAHNNLTLFLNQLQELTEAIREGNDDYRLKSFIEEVDLSEIKKDLEKLKPLNTQKTILPRLIASLDEIYGYKLPEYIRDLSHEFVYTGIIILGGPGTGKTHGLAHCVENHLKQNMPAILIQAKSSNADNWKDILQNAIGLDNWTLNEILSALESSASRNDVQLAMDNEKWADPAKEAAKAIICVDGLEEDMRTRNKWYARIRESVELSRKYPRVRFLFSSREYFHDSSQDPDSENFDFFNLPKEGDISIEAAVEIYFSKEHYNIKLSSPTIIRGLDSLLALRLFCMEYKGRELTSYDKVYTATRDLINLKINRLSQEFNEFISKHGVSIGSTRNPIRLALSVIAEYFYSQVELEHRSLIEKLSIPLSFLGKTKLDVLVDYLVDNGFLIRSEKIIEDDFLGEPVYLYNITYQSLIEHIISEQVYIKIKKGELNQVPKSLFEKMVHFDFKKPVASWEYKQPNELIIQGIVDRLFLEDKRLIGDSGFLIEGFSQKQILEMQLEALVKAPPEQAKEYEKRINDMFFGGFKSQFMVLRNLIIPSSHSSGKYFGAEYLHQILMNQISAFERDKLWSGLDIYEQRDFSDRDKYLYARRSLTDLLNPMGSTPYLSDYSHHNEEPLLFAWGLSTIDQKLRENLRISLTGWAIKQPLEFKLLLDKIFSCNDPQIQEDLASVTLGVASRLTDKSKLQTLAVWAIENVFNNLSTHRNVFVRQGFRAIVERAFQFNAISEKQAIKARPIVRKSIDILPLAIEFYQGEESYPIVHDLAWYVIKKVYEPFFEYAYSDFKPNEASQDRKFLNEYRNVYRLSKLSPEKWALTAAIAYMQSLGFSRKEGNGYTEASHGSKSRVFTYEEKYTWLAVHYLLGYLSDYLPLLNFGFQIEFVQDNSQLINIPNPAEFVDKLELSFKNFESPDVWVVKEPLSPDFIDEDFPSSILEWIEKEPVLDFGNWLNFSGEDLSLKENKNQWIAIHNRAVLHDPKKIVYTALDIKACLIKHDQLSLLKEELKDIENDINFHLSIDQLRARPDTYIYANPSDLVWMSWLLEKESYHNVDATGTGDDKIEIFYTNTEVISNNVEGENHMLIPSKKVRELLDIKELYGKELKDMKGNTKGRLYSVKDQERQNRDSQEMVLVDAEAMNQALKKSEYKIIWFAQLFRRRNYNNQNLPEDFQPMRTRKYLIWREGKKLSNLKFWDESYSNTRDV